MGETKGRERGFGGWGGLKVKDMVVFFLLEVSEMSRTISVQIYWKQGRIQDLGKEGGAVRVTVKYQNMAYLRTLAQLFFPLYEVWGFLKKGGCPDPKTPPPWIRSWEVLN